MKIEINHLLRASARSADTSTRKLPPATALRSPAARAVAVPSVIDTGGGSIQFNISHHSSLCCVCHNSCAVHVGNFLSSTAIIVHVPCRRDGETPAAKDERRLPCPFPRCRSYADYALERICLMQPIVLVAIAATMKVVPIKSK